MVLISDEDSCNVYDLCRLCMSEECPSTKMMQIADKYPAGSNSLISDMIKECLSIEVKDEVSNLLTQVCEDCVIDLYTFSDFKSRCNAVDSQLRQIIQKNREISEAQVLYGPEIGSTSYYEQSESEVSSVLYGSSNIDADTDIRETSVNILPGINDILSVGGIDIPSAKLENFQCLPQSRHFTEQVQSNNLGNEFKVTDHLDGEAENGTRNQVYQAMEEGKHECDSGMELLVDGDSYSDDVRQESEEDVELEIHVSLDHGPSNTFKVLGKLPSNGFYIDENECKLSPKPKQFSPSKRCSIPIPEVLLVINEEGQKQIAFKCQQCGQTFNNRVLHRGHVASHMKTKGYTCLLCNKWFPFKSALDRHERVHSGEKPYTCILCNRSFSQQEILQRHVTTHSDAKPFPCPHCDKGYTQKEALNAHLKKNHRELKKILQYLCPLCDKAFCHRSGLSRHLQLHTGKRHVCDLCTKQFSDISSLRRHQKNVHSNFKKN